MSSISQPSEEDVAAPPVMAVKGRTEATRYLCASAHLDEPFCRMVLRELVDQPFRAIAPCYGVDVAAVCRHALAARRRRLMRDLVLVVVTLFTVLVWTTELTDVDWSVGVEFGSVVDLLWPSLLVATLISWGVVSVEQGIKVRVLVDQLSRRHFDPDAVAWSAGQRVRRRLEYLDALQQGNVVVFGGYKPFVGSGLELGAWSLAIDISKGLAEPLTGTRRTPKPFHAVELHDYLRDALRRLGLRGLSVTDRMFVSGRDAWRDQRVLPEKFAPPVTSLPEDVLREALASQDSRVRTYLCCETTGWSGQLVVTTFLRAMRLRGSLFLESRSFALLPLNKWYQRVDRLAGKSAAVRALLVIARGVGGSLPLLVASPWRVASALNDLGTAGRVDAEQRRTISKEEPFDYGAEVSIREITTGEGFRRYFQQLDVIMYDTVVQEALLRGITEFLTEHDVDADQVTNLQATINNGNVFHGDVKITGDHNPIVSGKDNTANSDKDKRPKPPLLDAPPKRPNLDDRPTG